MQLESITLTNFRCFGPKPHTIRFEPDLTALIGANGSGKTAVMGALLRLIGTSAELRRVTRRDFHVPADEVTAPAQRTLSIDAVFGFPELDAGSDDDAGGEGDAAPEDGGAPSTAVPTFFEQMAATDGAILKFRLRLDATWTDDGSGDGDVVERLRAITTLSPTFDQDKDCKFVSPIERARLQMVYIPATRDGSSQLTSFLSGRLWRAILWSKAIRDTHQSSGTALNDAFSNEQAVQRIGEALKSRWQTLHTGGIDATPVLGPVDLRFDRFIRKIEVAFHPDESGRRRDIHELSDGQRSLFHLAMTATALDVESQVAQDPKGFDPDALSPPALTILAIEEPENNLAPFFLSRIVRQVQELTRSAACQAILSSHSASILGRVTPEQVRHFRLDPISRTALVNAIALPQNDEEASKFVREAVRAYPELYFARFVVLGEGSSEEIVLPRVAEAMGIPIDRSFVAVVPLGGRHVNHLWRLLRGLGIPFATLLDHDFGRSGGGWGRIKTAFAQLIATGTAAGAILPTGWTSDLDAELEARTPDQQLAAEADWFKRFRTHGVFFCSPLDLDMCMLRSLRAQYEALEPGMKGPSTAGEATAAVFGKDGDASSYDLKVWNDDFYWYRYLFLGRGKPTTHMRVLSSVDDQKLASDAPEVVRALIEFVSATLDLAAE